MRRTIELWEDEGGNAVALCFAGPRGDRNRRLLTPEAKLIHVYEAQSHFETMTIRNQLMGWEEYRSEPGWEALDKEPYGDED